MSKKIMKRSLALGALMAFVITGSAIGSEFVMDDDKFVYDLSKDIKIEENIVVSTSSDLSKAGSENYGVVIVQENTDVSLQGDINLNAEHLASGYLHGVRVGKGATYEQIGGIDLSVDGINQSKNGIRPLVLIGGSANLTGNINLDLNDMSVSRLQMVLLANGASLKQTGNVNLYARNFKNDVWNLNNTVAYYVQDSNAVLNGDINMTFINEDLEYGIYKNVYGVGIAGKNSKFEHNGNLNMSFGGKASDLFKDKDLNKHYVTIYGHVIKTGAYEEGENNVKTLSFGATDENGNKVPFLSDEKDTFKSGFANFDVVKITERSSLYINDTQVGQFTVDKLLANTDAGQLNNIEDVINVNEINSKGGALNLGANTLILENNATATMNELNSEGAKITFGEGAKLRVNGNLVGDATFVLANLDVDQVIVEEADGEYAFEINSDKIKEGDSLKGVAHDIHGNDLLITEVTSTSGDVYSSASVEIDEDGTLIKVSKTIDDANVAANDMASVGLMSYRAEMNDMNKRMGELRNANGEHGVWVRMVRGESEYNSVKNQYNQYQLGYDEKLSVDKRWTVGVAVSYTDAQNNFERGSGESTNKALAIYGSKLNDDGTFVDLIAKYARLENEFELVGGMGSADYDTNGYSFSAEIGKRIQQGKGLWIEPQVELTYGKVSAVDYVTENKVNVAQDGMESLVGRVGFSLGKDIKDGNVYARASYLYDFEGETQATLNNDAVLKQDLGGGWWEVGVGANINLSKATYIYADVEKTFGGEVDTNWQWNLGVRYSF